MAISPFLRDCATGACVGVTDIALVYPLAVIATRRENGLPLLAAIKQGRYWAGGLAISFHFKTQLLSPLCACSCEITEMSSTVAGWTAGTLLIPYSIAVESVSKSLQRSGFLDDSLQSQLLGALGTASFVTLFGLQVTRPKRDGTCACMRQF
jgi:hypothetical protein